MIRLSLIAFALLFATACRLFVGSTSSPMHDLGRYTNDSAEFQWAHLVDPGLVAEEVTTSMQESGVGDPDEKAAQRAQFWADRIFSVVRLSGSVGASIPPIHAHVLGMPAVQGSAMVVTACLPYEFAFEKR